MRFEDGSIYGLVFVTRPETGSISGDRVLVLGRARTVATDLMGLKERGQPFSKELAHTIKSRFDSFWSASQNRADLSVRQIVVRK